MMYLDLEELPRLFDGRLLCSTRRMAPMRYRRADYLGDPAQPLDEAVRDRVEQVAGFRPSGPVRMLTHLRCLGYIFNPVTFYYCFEADRQDPAAVVAEITNTPWGERHSYVLRDPAEGSQRFTKDFHVSPFQGMDHEYEWNLPTPGERLQVEMVNRREGQPVFEAGLGMQRREITGGELARSLAVHPFMTGKVSAAIYWQALCLWLRRTPFFPHPKHLQTEAS